MSGIQRGAIPKVDGHLHTSWTDGKNSVREMYDRAAELNLEWIIFSEHARKESVSWFKDFARQVRDLPNAGTKAFVGVETRVSDFHGALEATDDILEQCDWVMAAVHRFPGEKGVVKDFGDVDPQDAPKIEYELSCAVLRNPDVDILAHPFGMSIRRFKVDPPENLVRDLIGKAAKSNVAFEINDRYHKDPWQMIDWCKDAGARISLGSNAHHIDDVGNIVRTLEATR